MKPLPTWITSVTVCAILTISAYGVFDALVLGDVIGWSSQVGWILAAVLAFAAVWGFSTMFSYVRPARRAANAGRQENSTRLFRTAKVFLHLYSVACAIYGLVLSAVTGSIMYSLLFGAAALVAPFLMRQYVYQNEGAVQTKEMAA